MWYELQFCFLYEFTVKETEEAAMEMSSRLNLIKDSFVKRGKYFEKWNSTIANQLSALRSKIEQAKHLTNGVRFFEMLLIYLGYSMVILHVLIVNLFLYFARIDSCFFIE